jgi:hypothetical protein
MNPQAVRCLVPQRSWDAAERFRQGSHSCPGPAAPSLWPEFGSVLSGPTGMRQVPVELLQELALLCPALWGLWPRRVVAEP